MKGTILLILGVFIALQVGGQEIEDVDIQIERFAKNIERSIENGNPAFLNGSVDYNSLFGSFIVKEDFTTPINDDFLHAVKFNYGLGTIISEELGGAGKIDLINYSKESEAYHLLYRTFTSNGINYFELITEIRNNTLYITDAYIYKTSQFYGSQLENLYTSYLTRNSAIINKSIELINKQKVLQLENINKLIVFKKYHNAYQAWENLPENVKYEKEFLVKAIETSSFLNTTTTQNLISTFENLYGNKNEFYLIPLEGFYQRSEYQYALNTIDSLSVAVFNDSFLNLYRGLIYSEMKNIPQAEWYYKEFITKNPYESTGYFSLLELYLNNHEFASATELLDQLSYRFGYYKQDLVRVLEEYPEFMDSETYNNWIKE